MLASSEEDAPLRALGPFTGRSVWERWGEGVYVSATIQHDRPDQWAALLAWAREVTSHSALDIDD